MQLTLERPDGEYVLSGADGNGARVNGRYLAHSFILSPQSLIEHWPVTDASALTTDDLAPLFALAPEVILLGSGHAQRFPPAATLAACLGRGIGLETMTNAAAARTFNILAGERRRVVAGFVVAESNAEPSY